MSEKNTTNDVLQSDEQKQIEFPENEVNETVETEQNPSENTEAVESENLNKTEVTEPPKEEKSESSDESTEEPVVPDEKISDEPIKVEQTTEETEQPETAVNETSSEKISIEEPSAEESAAEESKTNDSAVEENKEDEDTDNNIAAAEVSTTEESKTNDSAVEENKEDEDTDNNIAAAEESTTEESKTNDSAVEENKEDEEPDNNEVAAEEDLEPTDYSGLNKQELLETLEGIIENKPILKLKGHIDNIKVNFYKKHNAEILEKKKEFIKNGGISEEFAIDVEPDELKFKELVKIYKDKKAKYNEELEKEKEINIAEKHRIIQAINDLTNSQESINKTFQEFRDLQTKWREIGNVPQGEIKNLWDTYNYTVEKFYDYIKINKELRDLDLKKNLELKITLCEKAEELILEPSIKKAFNTLQKYHNQWRETGPVPREKREEIWERFKIATSKINKKHQEYYEKLREEEEGNLRAKELLCDKAEELSSLYLKSHKEWEGNSEEMIELQKLWKLIGFAPKKENNRIYDRFRTACDKFFDKKRDFYAKNKEEQEHNLQQKTELCLIAESLQDSTDWKKTTEEYIQIQKKWKEIGSVPRKNSDAIWKRFRTACNKFFDIKKEYFNSIDKVQDENLRLKKELINKVENIKPSDDDDENLQILKDFQKQWTEIGFVPFKYKDTVQKEFRDAINKCFDNFEMDDVKKAEMRFKHKLKNISQSPKAQSKIRQEREKVISRLEKIESDISVWENNIGFFAKSKNAESLIKDMTQKIENAKKTAESLKEKLTLMDQYR